MPLFEYKPGARGRTAAPDLPNPPTYDRVNEDPFTVDPSLPVETRLSWLTDAGLWCQQFVSECAAMARKLDALKRKLEDPALADNPHRIKAVYRADELREEMIQAVRDAIWTEAEGDRHWQLLTVSQRRTIAGFWHTEPETPRLIGRAWFGIATFETWPKRFRLHRLMVNDFPWPLVLDLNAFNVWTWDPSPGPPDPWPDEGHMPLAIALELEGRA